MTNRIKSKSSLESAAIAAPAATQKIAITLRLRLTIVLTLSIMLASISLFLIIAPVQATEAEKAGILTDAAHFPDPNFREWISINVDLNKDGILSTDEIAKITRIEGFAIEGVAIDIYSLQGIEYLTELTDLRCGYQKIANLDISKNTKVTNLWCDGNQLTSLDVSKNPRLSTLDCRNNQLTEMDVSKNSRLTNLLCSGNILRHIFFQDVRENDWFYDVAQYVFLNGLIGYSYDPIFSPNKPTTRGMLVTALYNHAGTPDIDGLTNPFSDVVSDADYSKGIIWASGNGIVKGRGDGTFGTNDYISRQDLAVILLRYETYAGITPRYKNAERYFADWADISDYAKDAVLNLYIHGIIDGKPDFLFEPKAMTTNAETATVLRRFLAPFGDCFISVEIGKAEAEIIDGMYTFKNASFVENGFAYAPLYEIVELFGGTVKYNRADKSYNVMLPSTHYNAYSPFSQVWIGEACVLNSDKENLAAKYPHLYDTGKLSDFVPIIKNDIVYVPTTYFELFGLLNGRYIKTTSHIYISNCSESDYLAGFKVNSDFTLLDKEVRDRFKFTGKREELDNGALIEETFSDGDVELVIRTGEPRYMKNEGVKEEIHQITLVSDKYCSSLGLRVGDSKEIYYSVSGQDDKLWAAFCRDGVYSDGHIKVEIQNDKIVRFACYASP